MKNITFRLILGLTITIGLLVINDKIHISTETQETTEIETVTEEAKVTNAAPLPATANSTKELENVNIADTNNLSIESTDTAVSDTTSEPPVVYKEEIIDNTDVTDTTYTTTETELTTNEETKLISTEEVIHTEETPLVEETVHAEEIIPTEPIIPAEASAPATLDSLGILKLLSSSLVTASGGYAEHYGNDTINVFAEDIANTISVNTAVWYNMWGGNVQTVVYSTKKLQEHGNNLSFDIGIMSGGEGTMDIQIYISDSEIPDYEFSLDATQAPSRKAINISTGDSIKIVITNNAGVQNKVVFYNFDMNAEEV